MQENDNEVLEKEESFEELLKNSLVSIWTGDIVEGEVIDVTPTEIIVDLGFKSDGVIAKEELSIDNSSEPSDIAKVGDRIKAFVLRVRDGDEGRVELSLRKMQTKENENKIKEAAGTDKVISGKVTRVIDGGLIVMSGDTKIFVPASQTGSNKEQDLNVFLKKDVNVRIIEVDDRKRKIVGSMKQAAKAQSTKEEKEFWDGIFIGKEIKGKVKNFASFGVFIDLGGVDGLIHNSELSWEKNVKAEDLFNAGDEVTTWIKDFNPDTRKVSLGYKKEEDNPWNKYANDLKEGDIVNAKVVRITPFGAFAEIFPGVDGLIHISELDIGRVENVGSKVKIGQDVEAKVIKIEPEKNKISLSLAALMDGYQPAADRTVEKDIAEFNGEDKEEIYDEPTEVVIVEEEKTEEGE